MDAPPTPAPRPLRPLRLVAPTAPRRAFLPWLALGAMAGLAYYFRDLLLLVGIAFGIAYVLEPLVERLQQLRVPRPLAIGLVLLGVCVAMTLTVVLVLPDIVRQLSELAVVLPNKVRNDWIPWANSGLVHLRQRYHLRIPTTADAWINQLGTRSEIASRSMSMVQSAASASISVLGLMLEGVIVLAMAFYFISDWHRIVAGAMGLVPRRAEGEVRRIVHNVDLALGSYFRGQGLAMLVLGVLFAVGLGALGVPGGVALGIFAGLIAFIPYLGFFIALGLAILFASLDGGGLGHVLAVVAYMMFVHVLDLTVVTPRILGRSIGLSPVAVIVSLLAGARLMGFTGLLLAIPVASVATVLLGELVRFYKSSRFYAALPASVEPNEVDVALVQMDPQEEGAATPVVRDLTARITHQDGSPRDPSPTSDP